MNLESLVEKFKRKDEKAFESLYNMYSHSMHGVIYNIVRNNDIAEEVMQDIYQLNNKRMNLWNATKS